MSVALFTCPECAKTVKAGRLDWGEMREARATRGMEPKELEMGPYWWKGKDSERQVEGYRRVRCCSACNSLYATAELPEQRVWELLALTGRVRSLSDATDELAGAIRRMRELRGRRRDRWWTPSRRR